MNNAAPVFFEPIRLRSTQRWNQLEQDAELAGPWHQLFKQVQSPRHVLSELLQNADDAGATEASVRIQDGIFIFEHNGEDFTEEHFTSLCRFGYSNKRALHTIGFRGIGFKSIFSLGDRVELYTPSLSVAFEKNRFTEPHWIKNPPSGSAITQIRVIIHDANRQREVEKNLQEWLKSPVSLLFFNYIRRIRVGDKEIHWGSLGAGPVPETEWMALHDNIDETCLMVRSAPEPFPEEALVEIRQERMVGVGEDIAFPPCKVEIVLGVPGRLFVVLPTGVETALPFACNAPFIQDPARLKIKDPEISPTNRWLLQRAGNLAAATMLQWLEQPGIDPAERARAYQLFPDVDREDASLEGTCGTIVEEAFADSISERPYLLAHDDKTLLPSGACIIIPDTLLDVWPHEQAATFFDQEEKLSLSRHISETDRQKLLHWGVVDEITKEKLILALQNRHLPKPKTWQQLLDLWAYIAPDITGYRYHSNRKSIRIMPVQGKDILYSANEVVRLGEKKLLQSNEDWKFLDRYLLVLNPNWPRYLAEQRRTLEGPENKLSKDAVEAAYGMLEAIGFHDTSDVSKVIEQVATEFFTQESINISDSIQLAQIAAKLGASVGGAFRFVVRDRHLRSIQDSVLFDEDGALEETLPDDWCQKHMLHPDYTKDFTSCTRDEWLRWISSGRSGLHTFVPLLQKRSYICGRKQIENEIRKRGSGETPSYPYVTQDFVLDDWDFEATHWEYWRALASNDDRLWGNIAERIIAQPDTFWSKAKSARAMQEATTGTRRPIINDPLIPTWISNLRQLPCLPDTRGFYHKPSELLRRTPETEAFMDVEPFIQQLLDRETTRPLLTLLGVRDAPTGPDRLLNCLRALAKSEKPPVQEVEKWYRRLDQMVDSCSTPDLQNIKKAFHEEKLIFTNGDAWTTATGVFLIPDEDDVPGAALIRPSVAELTLWRKIGVSERPNADLAIQWLQALPSGQTLSQEEARRVRALLPRHASRIWSECGHWLNLAGEWVATDTLCYALTMQPLIPWKHLYEWVKQKTADFQRLPVEFTRTTPFSELRILADRIEDRFDKNLLPPTKKRQEQWLNTLGQELRRIELDSQEETARIRGLARNLAQTLWQTAPALETIPYIDGTPAGTARQTDAIWLDGILYTENRPMARLALAVAQELDRAFRRPDIIDAIKLCFDRSPEFVTDYMEENFKMAPRETLEPLRPVPSMEPSEAINTEKNKESETADPESLAVIIEAEAHNDEASGAGEDHAEEINLHDADATSEDASNTAPLHTSTVSRPQPKPVKPSMIERYARRQGFKKDGEDRFFHGDGSWIGRSNGARFPWERRNSAGSLIRYYWLKEHCLERDPLQLEADIWGLIDQHPEMYSFILLNTTGDPVEITGSQLRAMRENEEITLYPATYRLVYEFE